MANEYVLTGKAVDKLKQLTRGRAGSALRPGADAGTISPDEFALPFTVRWSAKEDAWVIWLPSTTQLVKVNGSNVSIGGITAAQELPAGWYTIDSWSSSGVSVFCNITITDATGAVSAEIAGTAASASTGKTVYPVRLAILTTNATTGKRTVKQLVTSAIVFSWAGNVEFTASGTVVSSVDYVTSTGDPDYAAHAFAIRIKRGTLTYNVAAGTLSVNEDANLKQFIATTPHSTHGGQT